MPKAKSKYQGVNGVYYLRNPGGAIAMCDYSHARSRLQLRGWALATDAEIERYRGQKVQRWDDPIGERFDPDAQLDQIDLDVEQEKTP